MTSETHSSEQTIVSLSVLLLMTAAFVSGEAHDVSDTGATSAVDPAPTPAVVFLPQNAEQGSAVARVGSDGDERSTGVTIDFNVNMPLLLDIDPELVDALLRPDL